MGYKQARLNKNYQKGDGLVAYTVDETIRSIGTRGPRYERNGRSYLEMKC